MSSGVPVSISIGPVHVPSNWSSGTIDVEGRLYVLDSSQVPSGTTLDVEITFPSGCQWSLVNGPIQVTYTGSNPVTFTAQFQPPSDSGKRAQRYAALVKARKPSDDSSTAMGATVAWFSQASP